MTSFLHVGQFKDNEEDAFWLHNRALSPIPRTIHALAWHPAGDQIASAHLDFVVRVWDVKKEVRPALVRYLVHAKYVVSVAWSPDGTRIASGDTQADPVRVWDVATGQEIFMFDEHESWPWAIAWHPAGHSIVSGGMDGRIFLWDAHSGAIIRQLHRSSDAFKSFFTALAWSADGSYLAASNLDGELLIWRTSDWALVVLENSIMRKKGKPFSWSPYHAKLATLRSDGHIRVLDIANGGKIQTALICGFAQPDQSDYCAVAWSPDGRKIAGTNGGSQVYVWNEGEILPPLVNSTAVISIAWKPGGSQLATGDAEGSISLWQFSEDE